MILLLLSPPISNPSTPVQCPVFPYKPVSTVGSGNRDVHCRRQTSCAPTLAGPHPLGLLVRVKSWVTWQHEICMGSRTGCVHRCLLAHLGYAQWYRTSKLHAYIDASIRSDNPSWYKSVCPLGAAITRSIPIYVYLSRLIKELYKNLLLPYK